MRSFDLRAAKDIPENAYDSAWFRLVNETTSQTLDYTNINKLKTPEGFEESPADEETEGRNEIIYVAGRVFIEHSDVRTGKVYEKPKWIYERFNQVVTS